MAATSLHSDSVARPIDTPLIALLLETLATRLSRIRTMTSLVSCSVPPRGMKLTVRVTSVCA